MLTKSNVITFFNYNGGVGKTTLVHNLGFLLAKKGARVLLIDADPQMNLTAITHGLSENIDHLEKFREIYKNYINLSDFLNIGIKNKSCDKEIYKKNIGFIKNKKGCVDLVQGDINIANIEADLYDIIKNKNEFTKDIFGKFQELINNQKNNYDFILIDTSPSASSIINGLCMISCDYFIIPIIPSFFCIQSIQNLSVVFQNWVNILFEYVTTRSVQGLDFNQKFLGFAIQMSNKPYGNIEESRKWIENLNFQKLINWLSYRNMIICKKNFKKIFPESKNFIIQDFCDFTDIHDELILLSQQEEIPISLINNSMASKKNNQFKLILKNIRKSYKKMANNLFKLKYIKMLDKYF